VKLRLSEFATSLSVKAYTSISLILAAEIDPLAPSFTVNVSPTAIGDVPGHELSAVIEFTSSTSEISEVTIYVFWLW